MQEKLNFIKNIFWFKGKSLKISSKNKINFLEQFSNLINSGIPIINSLKIIMYQTKDKKIKFMLEKIISDVNKWWNLRESFEKFPKIFWYFDLSIIEMWEVTWALWNSIETIKNKEEKDRELKWKIIWALIYPIVIVSLSNVCWLKSKFTRINTKSNTNLWFHSKKYFLHNFSNFYLYFTVSYF